MNGQLVQSGLFGEDFLESERGQTPLDEFKRWAKALEGQHAVPPATAAVILGVSPQRIDELIRQGRLQTKVLLGRAFVTEESLTNVYKTAKPVGRPKKSDMLKAAHEDAKVMVKKTP